MRAPFAQLFFVDQEESLALNQTFAEAEKHTIGGAWKVLL
jgi:hypothetical protein